MTAESGCSSSMKVSYQIRLKSDQREVQGSPLAGFGDAVRGTVWRGPKSSLSQRIGYDRNDRKTINVELALEQI